MFTCKFVGKGDTIMNEKAGLLEFVTTYKETRIHINLNKNAVYHR